MPYIPQRNRTVIDAGQSPLTIGELNYRLTQLCLHYLNGERSYSEYNAIIGVLESCKLEFYRRAVSCYEDQKIKENGDVF